MIPLKGGKIRLVAGITDMRNGLGWLQKCRRPLKDGCPAMSSSSGAARQSG
jgi:hypothetical protein